MAQVPAVPKLARARHLLRSAFLGADRPTEDMVPSERAALALRAAGLTSQPARQVTFLIPLVGPEHVGDWSTVVERLKATLQSFLAQEHPNWQAVICCQVKPDLPDDDRIGFLPFDDPALGNDKWRKLRVLNEALPDLVTKPGYVMSFDADDLLRRSAVAEMLNRQDSNGYLVRSGFVMDANTGAIALADRRSFGAPMRKPFWKLCGSCAALYHDPAEAASTAFLAEMTQHEHRMFPYLAALAGQPLSPMQVPSVLYLLNHGENFGARRGRVGYKTRFVKTYRITDAGTLADIREDFGLDHLTVVTG